MTNNSAANTNIALMAAISTQRIANSAVRDKPIELTEKQKDAFGASCFVFLVAYIIIFFIKKDSIDTLDNILYTFVLTTLFLLALIFIIIIFYGAYNFLFGG
mgnify:CR=1 FL=1|jgi:hypothetical protein